MDVLPVLCVLGIFSLALAVDKTIAPEDLDGSGDDEDFSGSGHGSVFDLDSKDVTVYSTSDSTLVPTVEGSTAAQEPEILDKEETKMEDATKSTETTKTPNAIIEDLFAVAKEATTPEATTSVFQQTTAGLIEEIDTKKHHHHHHHHHHHPHHHNHTTTPSTAVTSESDGHDSTDVPPELVEPHDLPEKSTTSAPHESDLQPQELTTPEHLEKHGVLLHEETTSGSTSNYADNEAAVEPIDADLSLDRVVTSTVAEDSPTPTDPHHHHHHHHHHHPHHTTTSSLDGSDVQQELTTIPSDLIEHEDNIKGGPTTTVAEDIHLHHGHPHHTHHHKTTPSTPQSTELEQPHEVHTYEPKGRRIHIPDVKGTTAVPVISDDAENDDFTSSTVVYNVSRNPFDEENLDSKEEGSTGGVDEDIYIEENAAVVNEGRMIPADPSTDDGTSDAAHGIMERKELLAGIIAGGVAGLVFAGFLVAFVLYRMKKKDEGSYSLEEPKQSNGGYQKPREQREFYA